MQRYCANLHSNASDPQSVGESSDDDAQQKPQCAMNVAHLLTTSLIWIIYQMVLKHPQNKNSKGALFCYWPIVRMAKLPGKRTSYAWNY